MPADRADPAPGGDTVEVARTKMLAAVAPLARELIGTEAAAGRTLAATLQAARAQPPFRSSAMDGYGVRAADLALGRFTVLGEALAGRGYAGGPLGTSAAVRIFTGAPVPEGVDVVVPQERARREGETVWLDMPAPLRTNIRAAGIDFKAGDLLVRGGTRLHSRHVALIAAAGIASVSVTRQPRVAVLATGNEIVPPGARAAPEQIFDSVSFGLGAMIEDWGGKPIRIAARPDETEAIAAAIEHTLGEADLVVIIGGASVGAYDVVKPSLAGLGLAIAVQRIAIRPGKPTWFGTIGGKPVLGLAGNPAAAMVCAHLFLRPLVRALLAREPEAAASVAARLEGEVGDSGANECYLRAVARTDAEARMWARPFDNQDTSLVSVFAAANALIRRPAGAKAAVSGSVVEVMLLDRG
jgi:molybdopterin molybdotransferase